MSFLASSLTRLVATANSQARSFCIEVCLKARTNVSCATSSAQSRSPRRRVRYLTNAALYVRKSRSTSVTRSPAVSQQCQVAISQLLFSGWSQLDCHAATCYNHALPNGKGLAQLGHHLEQLEVCIREWLQLQHGPGFLVANICPNTVAQYEGHVARSTHVRILTDTHSRIRCRETCRRALRGGRLCSLELNGGGRGRHRGTSSHSAIELHSTSAAKPPLIHTRLNHQIGRELCRNTEAFSKLADLIVDLLRSTVLPFLRAQIADPLSCPQSGDE